MATYTRRYSISDDVKKKQEAYANQLASMPTYTSRYQDQLNSARDAITNRDAFKYDINADALYQQLRDQYQTQGQMAMMDTIGQATALTGGYGNSYAQNAGQQAYHGYLQQLNNQIPDLYNMALNRYAMEGDALAQNYGMMLDAENLDYSRYQDGLANWQNELARLQSDYNNALSFDYSKYRDEVADDMWQTQYDLSMAKASGGYGGGSGGGQENKNRDNAEKSTTLKKSSYTPEEYDVMSYADWQQRRDAYLAGGNYTGSSDPVVAAGVEDYSSYAEYAAAINENNLEAKKYYRMTESRR